MITSGLMTSNTDEWATPWGLFNKLDAVFNFTLDVCATPDNAKCAKYFTKEQDGLKQDWGGGCYMVQPTIWPRDQQMGAKMCYAQGSGSYVSAGSN